MTNLARGEADSLPHQGCHMNTFECSPSTPILARELNRILRRERWMNTGIPEKESASLSKLPHQEYARPAPDLKHSGLQPAALC